MDHVLDRAGLFEGVEEHLAPEYDGGQVVAPDDQNAIGALPCRGISSVLMEDKEGTHDEGGRVVALNERELVHGLEDLDTRVFVHPVVGCLVETSKGA